MFLDVTFLKDEEYKTLLTLTAITLDNRTLPVAHMIYRYGKQQVVAQLFLSLIKRHLPCDWDNVRIMCDQSMALKNSIRGVFGKNALECTQHLKKNLVRYTSDTTMSSFQKYIHTLDENEWIKAKEDLLNSFHQPINKGCINAYNLISNNPDLFCRIKRDDNFEQFTTNAVGPFHGWIRSLKKGHMVNLVSQLSMMQLCALQKLSDENVNYHEHFCKHGSVLISLKIGLALSLKVETIGNTIKVRYDPDTNCDLTLMFNACMKILNRRESYTSFRMAYINSLKNCTAELVTKSSCSQCKMNSYYVYCPHILAVRLQSKYKDLWTTLRTQQRIYPLEKRLNYVLWLTQYLCFSEFVDLVGAHPSLYFENTAGGHIESKRSIYDPTEVTEWVAHVVNFLDRSGNSDRDCEASET